MTDASYRFPQDFERLEIEGLLPAPALPWLERSWRDPAPFWAALFAHHAARFAAPPKSRPFEHYDFYHDIVLQNLALDRAAFVWHDVYRGWQELTFSDLDFRCSRRAAHWTASKVEEGQKLCLLLPVGPDLLISLLTALRLGLQISYLPPGGDRFVARRLAALKPDHIAADPAYRLDLGDFAAKLLPDEPAAPRGEPHRTSASYLTGTPVGRFFSPFSKTPHLPQALAVDDLYLRALRDGIVALGLRRGDAVAAPDLDPLPHQPALLLAVLLGGGTYVHLTAREIAEDPRLLHARPLRTLGISRRLRDVLFRSGGNLSKACGHWFRTANESTDLARWHEFARALGLDAVPASSLHYDSAAGGALFFSTRRKGGVHLPVLPSAGVAWSLADLSGSGREAAGTHGFFAPARTGGKAAPGTAILARNENEWFFVGTMDPVRRGYTYPRDEVLACVAELSIGREASIVPVPSGGHENPFLFILVVFVGGASPSEIDERAAAWSAEIENAIARHLGEDWLPDRIDFYPLYARSREGRLDHDWIRSQYLTGALERKRRGEADRLLTALRAAAVRRERWAEIPPQEA
jgi:hypothetical protein